MQACRRVALWYGLVLPMGRLVEHFVFLGLPISCVPRDPRSNLAWVWYSLAVWTLQVF